MGGSSMLLIFINVTKILPRIMAMEKAEEAAALMFMAEFA